MNHLQYETSPYLLQHAHNPVNWYAWKEEAFERAVAENKPILVSIGYSTCHWCHVMERESFEDEATAAFMNEHFINIKVDREERPDVDQIYMEACQAISGSGGWPLNCFLTPDKRPFYAGTYYPPRPAHNRPSWIQLMQNIIDAFQNKREVVEEQADRLIASINNSDTIFIKSDIGQLPIEQKISMEQMDAIFERLEQRFDTSEGGFGGAPKFPGTMSLEFLLDYHHLNGSSKALDHLTLSLDKMIMGGIYDQLGGGFARYATDRAWLVPHFEKMLYDNALLVDLLAKAYQKTGNELYRQTIEETLEFIQREMTSSDGVFYSALDADSEGVEGKFYVWDQAEVKEVLKEEAELFSAFYDVTEGGNWEGKNILWRKKTAKAFAEERQIPLGEFEEKLLNWKSVMMQYRSKRIRPGLDDKVLLSWNALQITAYCSAYKALGHESYRQKALRALDFILEKFRQGDKPDLFHTYKEGQAQYNGFLDDYAFLIAALLDVYQITFDIRWLQYAKNYTDLVLAHFLDKEAKIFYFTSASQKDIPIRRKDMLDSAVPSGNSTMLSNLRRLSMITGRSELKELAEEMLVRVKDAIFKYPGSFSCWARSYLQMVYPAYEIAVVGANFQSLGQEINRSFHPNILVMASLEDNADFPLLFGRDGGDDTNIYVCKDYACEMPVKTILEMEDLVKPV